MAVPGPILDFRFTLGAMKRFKALRGKDVSQMDGADMDDHLALILAGIQHKHPEMTLDQLADLIEPKQSAAIHQYIDRVISEATGVQAGGGKNP
jgi:hypothetical protein